MLIRLWRIAHLKIITFVETEAFASYPKRLQIKIKS